MSRAVATPAVTRLSAAHGSSHPDARHPDTGDRRMRHRRRLPDPHRHRRPVAARPGQVSDGPNHRRRRTRVGRSRFQSHHARSVTHPPDSGRLDLRFRAGRRLPPDRHQHIRTAHRGSTAPEQPPAPTQLGRVATKAPTRTSASRASIVRRSSASDPSSDRHYSLTVIIGGDP